MPSKTFKRKNVKSKNKNKKSKKSIKRNSKRNSRSNKIMSSIRKMRGGANTQLALNTTESTEQDDFFVSIYDLFLGKDSKKFIDKTQTQINATREEVFHYFFEYVYTKEHVFTNNYVAKLVINLCKPYLKADIILNLKSIFGIEANFYEIKENLNKFLEDKAFIPEKGLILKKYGLTNLTAKPEKALELLNTCKDDELYCPMDIEYYFSDYIAQKPYLCDVETANPEHDIDDEEFYNNNIFRINNAEELSNFKTKKVYLYSMLPDETLCLFKKETKYGNHHSAGSCGQPVICAGFITVENGKIKTFNNDSGHYKPPIKMIIKFRDILLRKGMIENEGNIGVIPASGIIPFFLITVDIVDKSMLTPLYYPFNDLGKPINTSSKNYKAKLKNN